MPINSDQNNSLPLIMSDSPAPELFSKFQFDTYIQALFDCFINPGNETPFVISIEGDWGSGKTTLMKHLKIKLDKAAGKKERSENKRICHTVWFQAWKYNEQDEILSALIQEIINSMNEENFLKGNIASFFQNYSISSIITNILKSIKVYGFNPFENYDESQHKKNLAYYYHFQSLLKILINLYTSRISKREFIKTFRNIKKLPVLFSDYYHERDRYDILIIFIDDLDRCSDEKIVKVLESIKLFLDFPGCAIVMGISPSIISSAVKKVTKDHPIQYLEKIIQVRFPLPSFHKDQFKKYLEEIIKKNRILERYNIPIESVTNILSTCSETPRQCKQFLNSITFLFEILDEREILKKEVNLKLTEEIKQFQKENRFVYKLLILADNSSIKNIQESLKIKKFDPVSGDYYFNKLGPICETNPSIIDNLASLNMETKFDKNLIRENTTFFHFLTFYLINDKINRCFQSKKSAFNLEHSLSYYLKDTSFWQDIQKGFIHEGLISDESHRDIFNLLARQINDIYSLVLELPADETNLRLLIYHGLEAIPRKASPTEYYEQMVSISDEFLIDKFPVTNRLYIKFLMSIKDKKRSEIENYIILPYSKISTTEKGYTIMPGYENHPVTGVTWKGADAFAKYYKKSLPCAEQWIKAFGENNYPYGDSFDGNKCNTFESNRMDTTPVDRYSDGVNLKGVFDMSGNVWEWCVDKGEEKNHRIIKGGSWANRKEDAQRTNEASFPENRGMANIGFRCVSRVS